MHRLTMFLSALLLPMAAAAQCVPSDLAGAGTKAVLELNTTGGAVAWWCQGRFEPSLTLYAARWDAMSEPLRADLNALPSAPDQVLAGAEIARMLSAHATTHLDSAALRPVWAPAGGRISTSRPANPVWLVARNGTYTTRPTYPVVNGVRSTTATTTRATVSASCGCVRLRVIEGQTTYCGIDGESQRVAVCTRQPD